MMLITKAIAAATPLLYATENVKTEDKWITAKFFTPDSSWTWYMIEYDPAEELAFGYVEGLEAEWGYFSIPELQEIRGKMGLPIERDRHFRPCKFSDRKEILQERKVTTFTVQGLTFEVEHINLKVR